MTQALIVIAYLAIVIYIGVFAFRKKGESGHAEGYFLAGRSLGPVVFLLSLFGTNMTVFAILGSSGHAFANGIVTYGLMASSSGLVIPLTIAYFTALHTLLFPDDPRYHLPILPFLAISAAGLIVAVAGRSRQSSPGGE